MAGLTDGEWEELARDVRTRVGVVVPEWTDYQESDPGITILELFAFLTESLLDRPNASPRTRSRLHDVITQLEARAVPPCEEPPLRRTRYFHGRVLSVDDFSAEQDYVRGKERRHNLHLHGVGVVRGLDVTVDGSTARPLVTVSPGVAIGPDGEELHVCEPLRGRGRTGRTPAYVTLHLVDRPGAMVPALEGDGDGEASQIEEVVEIEVAAEIPSSGLAIGRLERTSDGWRLDPTFKAPRPDR